MNASIRQASPRFAVTSRCGDRGRARWLTIIGLASVAALAQAAHASHFRFGHITWKPRPDIAPNTAEFTILNAFRRDGYSGSAGDGFPAVGDFITEFIGGTSFIFDDGNVTGFLTYEVIAIAPADNWLLGRAIDLTCPAPGVTVAESEPNDTFGTADPISGGTHYDGEITAAPPDPEDYVSFSATAGQIIEATTILDGTMTDSFLTLYDTDGTTPLASDDDGGPGFASRIVFPIPATGTYFIAIDGFGGSTGTYSFELRVCTPVNFVHTYATTNNGGVPWLPRIDAGNRIGTLQNCAGCFYRVETEVDFDISNSSPVSSISPVVNVPINTVHSFFVPAADADGDILTWRFATSAESQITDPIGPGGTPDAPNTPIINPLTGEITWDTNGTALGQLYTLQVVIEESRLGGPLPSHGKVAVDFILQIVGDIGDPPTCDITPPGPFNIVIGQPLTFVVSGTDPDVGDTLTLNSAGLPPGATMTPPLPAMGVNAVASTFNWTPSAGQDGVYIVTFSVTDPNGLQTSCSVTITVAATGRCCKPNGICVDVPDAAACTLLGGSFGGPGTTCAGFTCPVAPGRCCLPNGTCQDVADAVACTALGGLFAGPGTTCAGFTCPLVPGRCCLPTGICQDVPDAAACNALGGSFAGAGATCAGFTCPVLPGRCCLPAGICQDVADAAACTLLGGSFAGAGTTCAGFTCPVLPGRCCLPTGICLDLADAAACTALGGSFAGAGTTCTGFTCPVLPGRCCLPNGTCQNVADAAACTALGGSFAGAGTACAGFTCPVLLAQDRVSATEKGSVLIYDKVELRYTAAGALIQDTFIDIANDFPADVRVKMYFINGDPRIVVAGVLVEPGWNWVNNVITLTANEPTYWSAATGLPKGVSPFGVLDPGALPGRPDPEVPGERMLRGFIIAFAVNAAGCEIRWNHLKGDACIVRYDQNSAWEYNAWSFAAGVVENGQPLPECGTLRFNGIEYAPGFDQLLMDFYAIGSAAFSTPGSLVTLNTDLTLHPLSADLRQETAGPVQTKASFDIWNMNEVKFSGTDRCITCWNQALLSSYGLPNHFFLVNLQTDKGRARIDGLASAVVCPAVSGVAPASSIDPLLGVVAKHLTFNGATFAVAGTNLHGLGTQTDGVIQFNASGGGGPPPENTGSMWLDTIGDEINDALGDSRRGDPGP